MEHAGREVLNIGLRGQFGADGDHFYVSCRVRRDVSDDAAVMWPNTAR
jgi:hypothetical protein